jgi:hypothetical protein
MSNADRIRAYLAVLSDLTSPTETLAAFLHPEVEQIEFPNRLVPNGATRNRQQMLDGFARGKTVTKAQNFGITKIYEDGDTTIAEFDWWAELTVPIGSLAVGERMTGKFITVVEFKDGLVHRQRNYDCFDPF